MNSTDQPQNAPKAETTLSELQEKKLKLEICRSKKRAVETACQYYQRLFGVSADGGCDL